MLKILIILGIFTNILCTLMKVQSLLSIKKQRLLSIYIKMEIKKMKFTHLKQALLALALSTTAYSVSADWDLNNKESALNFISIKKLSIGEVHSFKSMKGSLKDNGEAQVTVNLKSVETMIPKRNERMKKELFEVIQFPQASVKTKLNIKKINKLKIGESYTEILELALSIHGQQQEVEADLRITALADNKILASTIKPIIIKASDFNFVKGIEVLRTLAKLPSISTAVPVSASFIFEKN